MIAKWNDESVPLGWISFVLHQLASRRNMILLHLEVSLYSSICSEYVLIKNILFFLKPDCWLLCTIKMKKNVAYSFNLQLIKQVILNRLLHERLFYLKTSTCDKQKKNYWWTYSCGWSKCNASKFIVHVLLEQYVLVLVVGT